MVLCIQTGWFYNGVVYTGWVVLQWCCVDRLGGSTMVLCRQAGWFYNGVV